MRWIRDLWVEARPEHRSFAIVFLFVGLLTTVLSHLFLYVVAPWAGIQSPADPVLKFVLAEAMSFSAWGATFCALGLLRSS